MESKFCFKCGKILESNNINTSDPLINSNIDKKYQTYFTGLKKDSNSTVYTNIPKSNKPTNLTDLKNGHVENVAGILGENSNKSVLMKTQANIYEDIKIESSQNIIIGDITNVTGPINIIQITNNIEEHKLENLFMNESELETSDINIISRKNWMARPAKNITPLPQDAQYVIIAHTATEDGFTQSQNALLVKIIQSFHVESHHWDDIAYNFLVGCEGNVYEGRGWNVQGAHTYGYNKKSICIAFIGCFMDHLPPTCALKAARELIKMGVELGFIPEDYTLVGHCQCVPFESPGFQLFNEIKKWPGWRELSAEDAK